MPEFKKGDQVQVKGTPHEEGQDTGAVAIINDGPAYGIRFAGDEDMVHKWYVGEELRLAMPTQATEFQGRMPRQLLDYWIHGEGRIRLHPEEKGAFDRCRRLLAAESHGTITDLEGTCANLIHEATGHWPGEHHGFDLGGRRRWRGPLAPIGRTTGDGRVFKTAQALSWRTGPLALNWQEHSIRGHEGGVTVGGIDRIWIDGDMVWGEGFFFDPDIIAESAKAQALVEAGVSGPSIDLDNFAATGGEFDGVPAMIIDHGRISRVTLVSLPAFADLRLELLDSKESSLPFNLDPETFAVNLSGWKGLPIAPRESEFDADDAYLRIAEWAGAGTDAADDAKMHKMYLYRVPDGQPLSKDTYRLPIGDIFDGKPHLMYHAIYAGAALLSGGHGGLPNIPDPEKARLREVITDIYKHISEQLEAPDIIAPWDRQSAASLEDLESFAGKYTEGKHPRTPSGTDAGGEWVDVPGHGPHGEIIKGGKKTYPPKKESGQHRAPEKTKPEPKKEAEPKKESKPAAKAEPKKESSYGERVAAAKKGEEALTSPPAKLKRAAKGHEGNYEGEGLDAPDGHGDVRAISEMEGLEYAATNGYLWRKAKGDTDSSDKDEAARVAELDKTMDVSKLPEDAVVYRGVKHGPEVFGYETFTGMPAREPGKPIDFDAEDAAWERFQQGHRPDLTGLEWTQQSYLHTTVNEKRLAGYAHKDLEKYPVAMRILLPKGTKGIQMSEIDHEAEIMADRGLKLRVVKDNGEDAGGVRHLDVEVVGGTR